MVKRIFDFAAALTGLILLSPGIALVSFLIKISSPGPVIYHHRRMGRRGGIFSILKFRTMRADAGEKGPGVTYKGDPRITRIGKFLRDTKLDEIPQLVNVLRGEMSIVGPRAEEPEYRDMFTGKYARILEVPPGMTGPCWVKLREFHEENIDAGDDWRKHYLEVSLPSKLAVDLEYVRNLSFRHDIGLIFRTLGGLLKREAR